MCHKGSFVIIICFLLVSFVVFPPPTYANNVPDRSHSSLSVSSSVPADGQTTAIITVTLQDSSGNPVAGDTATLEDSSNSGATITTMLGTTDGSGHAVFSIKSTKSQTDNLNVTDTTANVKFYNLGQITFTAAGCYDSPPGSTPRLTSALANGPNQIIITWTDAANPVTRYLISYGLASGQYVYGNPNVGGQGTTSYTVGSLSPGRKYYFVVQAINGCTPGGFSNEVSAMAGAVVANSPAPAQTAPIDISSKTNSQNEVTPTKIPTPSQTIQPTAVVISTQIPATGDSNAKIVLFISISIVVVGSIGNFLYWKYKKKFIRQDLS